MIERCRHMWIPSLLNGKPDFRTNRQMSTEPIVYVKCRTCDCRTWFTRTQWNVLAAAGKA